MTTKNPTGLPTVVLGGNAHMDALAKSFDNILNNVKVTAEVNAAKQAQLDQSLIPPEVDWDSIYWKDQEHIQSLVKNYSDKAVGYWEQGVNHLNPSSGSAYKEMRDMENDLMQAVAQSAQDKKIDEEVVTTMTKKGFGDVYDLPETLNRLSQFREAPISERRKIMNDNGGFYKEKPFDWNAFTDENMPKMPDVFIEDKNKKGGYIEWNEVTGYSNETAKNTASAWLQNPGYAKHVDEQLKGMSVAAQVDFTMKATEAGVSPQELYAQQDFNKKTFKQTKYHVTKVSSGSSGSGNAPKEAPTFDLAVRVSAMWRGDTAFYTGTKTLNGKTYQSADFPVTKFGKFKNVNADKNNKGSVSISQSGMFVTSGEQSFSDNYLEGVIRDQSGQVLVTTTETNENALGTKMSDGLYYVPATDRFWTEFLNGAVNGQEYSKSALDAFVLKTKALKENGDYDFNKFYTPEALRPEADDTPANFKKKK
ncbi:MAG TPA: hypothetical protein PLJ00_05885 [Chitinophagales bacterium]|nr:hypothetical protein [Chitinophagales bacterium]